MTSTGGPRLGRASVTALDAQLALARRGDLTYDHVGSTLHPERFPEHAQRTFELEVDDPGDGFADVIDGLRSWVPHHHLGARIHPPDATIEVGTTLLVVLPYGPFDVVAPDRIIEVIDEPHRFGFAYGTLPGHPECGEESFLVERIDGSRLHLRVRIDARPATVWARLASPLVTLFQNRAAACYLQGLAQHIRR
ncbi:hypothetical protein BH20ACT1_BH20ACT1_06150 [soil metagenome]